MKKYNFYQDVKMTVWERQHFVIEADTLEEAKEKAAKYATMDVSAEENVICTSEILYDTEELMTPEENNGMPTIEIYLSGEEKPFITNGDEKTNFDLAKSAIEVAYGEMGKYTMETTVCDGGCDYYAFHAEGKLNIIITDHILETAKKYTFSESWEEMVNNNEHFRKRMADYLIRRDIINVPFVHDWLTGHLTKMQATSDAVDDCTPFDIMEVVKIWGDKATVTEYKRRELIGFQIIGNEDEMPEDLTPEQVIRERKMAMIVLAKARIKFPYKDFQLYPIYEGEIKNVTFIE